MSKVWKPVERISDLKAPQVIRRTDTKRGYVVHANYGAYAFAVRTQHVSNPVEWEMLVDEDDDVETLEEL